MTFQRHPDCEEKCRLRVYSNDAMACSYGCMHDPKPEVKHPLCKSDGCQMEAAGYAGCTKGCTRPITAEDLT